MQMGRWRQSSVRVLLACSVGALVLTGALMMDWRLSRSQPSACTAMPPPIPASATSVCLIPLDPGPQAQVAITATGAPNLAWAERLLSAPELTALSMYLARTFPCRYEVSEPLAVPDECFVFERGQYDLDKVLVWLQNEHRAGTGKVLGLLPGYAYADAKPWLTGRARLGAPVAVISTWRVGLRLTETDESARWVHTQRRWQTVVCHELGHAFGLPHNPSRASLMFGGQSLEDLDAQSEVLLKDDLTWLDAHSGVDWGR
jgi:predicted Zn-dependent protease